MTGLESLRLDYPWPNHRPNLPVKEHGWLHGDTAGCLTGHLSRCASVVIESGSWLGKSASLLLRHALNATLICIDTWRGSPEHQAGAGNEEWASHLPTLYDQFIANMWEDRNRLIPIREDSFAGLDTVHRLGITPDLIYLDSEHSEARVLGELTRCTAYWPQSIIVLDDCNQVHIANACRIFAMACGRQLDDSISISFAILPKN